MALVGAVRVVGGGWVVAKDSDVVRYLVCSSMSITHRFGARLEGFVRNNVRDGDVSRGGSLVTGVTWHTWDGLTPGSKGGERRGREKRRVYRLSTTNNKR